MSALNIVLVWNGPPTGTSANLFKALGSFLAERHKVVEAPNDVFPASWVGKRWHMIRRDVKRWPEIMKCDVVLLHSYVALAFPSILLAWVLRKRIVIVHWDVYPITVNGARLGGRGRALFDWLERLAVRFASRVVLPSEDYLPFVRHRDIRILPLWPSLPIEPASAQPVRAKGDPIRFAFVGQAHRTRGLPEAILRLGREAPTKFEVHIFSPDPIDPAWAELSPNVAVTGHAYRARKALLRELRDMDFGLISLHPGLGQPGFPSKVFDYVAAGLPVVYIGRPLHAFEQLLLRTGVGFVLGEASADWFDLRNAAHRRIPAAVLAFRAETDLTHAAIEQAFF
jgi:hypothetical protein